MMEATLDDITRKKVEQIYGLLWNVNTDRSTYSGAAVSEARKLALSMIDKEGQASGIGWANDEIPKVVRDLLRRSTQG